MIENENQDDLTNAGNEENDETDVNNELEHYENEEIDKILK